MRLGMTPSHPNRVANAPRHTFGAVPPPAVLDRSSTRVAPELYENDTLPDCTAVAYLNGARFVAALNGYDLYVADLSARDLYSRFIPAGVDAVNTDGAVPLDVLESQIIKAVEIGPQGLVAHYGVINHSRSALATSLARFGFGYWGVMLYERDMDDFSAGRPWTASGGRDDGQPVGGHMIPAFDYLGLSDDATVRVGTWGRWQAASWSWIAARLMEPYGLVWRQLARADGTFYNGVGADGLISEL